MLILARRRDKTAGKILREILVGEFANGFSSVAIEDTHDFIEEAMWFSQWHREELHGTPQQAQGRARELATTGEGFHEVFVISHPNIPITGEVIDKIVRTCMERAATRMANGAQGVKISEVSERTMEVSFGADPLGPSDDKPASQANPFGFTAPSRNGRDHTLTRWQTG
jgi:hypothetical protein